MLSPVLNGEQLVEGMEREGGSADNDYADDIEDISDDSEESEEVESPPQTEHRSKQIQDPVIRQGSVVASSVSNPKCTQTATPNPTEKSSKHPKVALVKPRKALPRIKGRCLSLQHEYFLFFSFFLSYCCRTSYLC